MRALCDVFLGDVLVDHISHPLSSRFRGKGQRRISDCGHLIEHCIGQAVSAQRRHREGDVLLPQFGHHLFHQRFDGAVICG